MKNRQRFSEAEQQELLCNRYVEKCSAHAISYQKAFKIKAVARYHDGLSPREIFREAGFNLSLIGKDSPKNCLAEWVMIAKKHGTASLLIETRGRKGGRKPTPLILSDKDRIQYLEAEVAYLKAENNFLAKLRAQRKE